MKVLVSLLCLAALASAAPKASRLHFRNLYKTPVKSAAHKPEPHIIGGQEATPHSFPYQVFLEVYNETFGWQCGGSLISENYVLTAGHCGDGAVQALVVLGAHRPLIHEATQLFAVSTEITVHPGFDHVAIVNDIGVLRFSQPIPLSDVIQVVPLPTKADVVNTYAGDTGTVSGWGLTNGTADHLVSEVLNYVDLEIITNQKCEEDFGDLDNSILCTSGEKNTGTCNGDSGGPLTVGGVQVGIVSFGVEHCPPGWPDAFTRVTSFLDWLEENTDVKIA